MCCQALYSVYTTFIEPRWKLTTFYFPLILNLHVFSLLFNVCILIVDIILTNAFSKCTNKMCYIILILKYEIWREIRQLWNRRHSPPFHKCDAQTTDVNCLRNYSVVPNMSHNFNKKKRNYRHSSWVKKHLWN